MKRDIGVWILGLFLFGSVLVSFGIYRDNQKGTLPPKTSVEGAKTEAQTVQTVTDGDTLTMVSGDTIRLIGINAPDENQPNFLAAKNKLESLVLGKSVRVDTDIEKTDQNGRALAYLYVGDTFVNVEMIKSGLAVVDTVLQNGKHSGALVKAQEDARKSCAGMWEGLCHPDASACLQLASIHQSSMSANLNDEWVEVQNTCSNSQNLQGYVVRNVSAANSYIFKNVQVAPKKRIKLHSGCSTDSIPDLYWQCPPRPVPVWNNTGNSAYLYNATGKLVSEMSY